MYNVYIIVTLTYCSYLSYFVTIQWKVTATSTATLTTVNNDTMIYPPHRILQTEVRSTHGRSTISEKKKQC